MDRTAPADLVLRDAPLYRQGRWDGDCVAITDGRIAALGSSADVAALVGPDTRVESLADHWLLPAFHDAHVHPIQAGVEMNQCDLTGETTIEGYLERVRAYAEANPDRTWVTGGGWSMDSFPGGVPTAALLDRACPDRPVYLPNRDHHSAWVNSRALELAGLTADSPDPADGRIERDADGHPTGALHEGAMALVGALTPPATDEELMAGLLTAQRHLHSLGIVGWQDALVGRGLGMPDGLDTYLAAQRAGHLTAKVVLAQWWDRERGLEQVLELVERRERAARAGLDAWSVKIMQDGVCETHTAAMLQPYLDGHGRATDNHGLSFIPADDLARYVTALDAEGFQVHIHALGDRAVRDSLDAVQRAREVNGDLGHRHHLAHVQVVDPADVPRFAELDVTANAQPLWACREEAMDVLTLPFVSEVAREQQYVFGSLLRSGARLACGSDWPVSDAAPLLGMHVAVNRRAPDQPADSPALLPDEALSVEQAIAGYTTGATWVNRLEDRSGRLEVGYAADLVAVDRDVLGADPAALGDTRVTRTFADGVEVHRA
ncbi:amidohydrolase [Nocardioides sp. SYSU DS0663]|uniref:amidohydrolase n=1 Tax=Nocardioides sp. SYSU DS0663 TaxID=3416445 RepID=UPI003F4B8103